MTHTEKFHSKPYRTDVSYMSSLGPCRGSGNQAPTPPPQNRGVIYCNINSIAVHLQKTMGKTKAHAQLLRQALSPLKRTVQFPAHWVAQEQQASTSLLKGSTHSSPSLLLVCFFELATITPLCRNTLI